MNQWLVLVLMFLYGALLGALYLYGLWLTVRGIQCGGHPAVWLMASWGGRTLLLVFGLYFILGDAHWQHLLAALGGFVTLRVFITQRIQHRGPMANSDSEQAV